MLIHDGDLLITSELTILSQPGYLPTRVNKDLPKKPQL